MRYKKTKISIKRQITEVTKDDSMATNKQKTQQREQSVNTGMCEFEGRKHGIIASVPLSAQLTLTKHCHHWQKGKTLHVSDKHA